MGDNGSSLDQQLSKGLTLLKGVQQLREGGLYTDLTLRCNNGEELKVHKAVLCAQSRFFHTACKPDSPFKEARTGLIELTEDYPPAVKAMVDYLYTRQYSYEQAMEDHFSTNLDGDGDGDGNDNGNGDHDDGNNDTECKTEDGDGGGDDDHDDDADNDEDDDDDDDTDFYDDDDNDYDDEERQHWLLMFHLKCFLLADKYEIPHMAVYARHNIYNAMESIKHGDHQYYLREGFPDAIKFVYDNTFASSHCARPLREHILGICVPYLSVLLINPQFHAVLDPVEEFWKELVLAQASLPQTAPHGPTWVECPECKHRFPLLLWPAGQYKEDKETSGCLFCSKSWITHLGWKKHIIHDVEGSEDRAERKQLVESAMQARAVVMRELFEKEKEKEKEKEREKEKSSKRKRTA